MPNNSELLTVPEAARVLRVGRNLAYELVARGEIPSLRLGRVIRVPRPALEAWIDEQARRPSHNDEIEGGVLPSINPHRSGT